ncbi:MAG: MotA/TolQ/ExbB proton channel family protein [Spirochaetales bacterium]|nr:MotA/TolQ/ExbB proton channel family protein [Spirochaetales bacterium]
MSLKELIAMGGWAMWPLMVFSVATISLIIERTVHILYHNLKVKDLKTRIIEYIERGDLNAAIKFLEECPRSRVASRILLAGIKVYQLGEHRVERAMETAALERINALENGFDLLVALGSIAPITGFLGTVSGMIGAFQSIATASEVNAQLVAGGIFEALITTAYGLSIAIVAIAGYNIFAHIVDKFTSRIEGAGSEIVMEMFKTNRENNERTLA